MNYNSATILRDAETGIRYYKAFKYPEIPLSETDIYIITAFGDRLEALSNHYYGNTDDAWIISVANGLPGDSLFFTPGTQLRIPTDTTPIKNSFNTLNGLS